MPKGLDPNGPLRIAYLTYRGKPHVGGQGVYTRHLTKALVDASPSQSCRVLTCSTTTTQGASQRSGSSRREKIFLKSGCFRPEYFLSPSPLAPACTGTSHLVRTSSISFTTTNAWVGESSVLKRSSRQSSRFITQSLETVLSK